MEIHQFLAPASLLGGPMHWRTADSDRDRWICDEVGPALIEKGLLFVGLDVIGDYLTEINVTSPTCIREIDNAEDTQIGDKLITAIQARLQQV